MEVYLSEEERVEALKKWWKENALAIVGGIALGIAIVAGWNGWKSAQHQKAEEASNVYQQLLKAVESKQAEPAVKLGERLVERYPGTTYAAYARLFIAKVKAESGDLAAAKKTLEELLASDKDENLKRLARLRMGRVMLALGESEAALKLVEPLGHEAMGEFESLYEELKGDLYAEMNRPKDARMAYEKAKQTGETTPLLELKINDLAEDSPSPAS
jgi:predicted negative regulator of RcsB-dependent stress response